MSAVALSFVLALASAWAAEPDLDGDGYTTSFDCDDADAAVNPGADEACDGIDNDCDALVDDDDFPGRLIGSTGVWNDEDGDGLGGTTWRRWCVVPSTGWTPYWGDCDDSDATVGGAYLSHPDVDGDGYGWDGSGTTACFIPSGNVLAGGDCNDADDTIHPAAVEVCNALDDNCDGLVDDADPLIAGTTFYLDADGDGYGDTRRTDTTHCEALRRYVAVPGDCDVRSPWTHPGADELCDGVDNDCDGSVDEVVAYIDWYADADGDGYGDPDDVLSDCAQPSGYAYDAGDCDDADAATSPAAGETCGNGIDDDCDGVADDCSRAASDVADFTVDGAEAGGFGWNVHAADANGDGLADLLVGEEGWNAGYGAAAVIYGPGAGEASSADAGLLIEGPRSSAGFGGAMAGGDYNGDGYDDVLVGAPGTQVNSAYLYYGPVTDADSSSDADVFIDGNAGKISLTASAVLIVPDHTGDGFSDLVIGVPGNDAGPGKAMLFSGHLNSTTSLLAGSAQSYKGSGYDRTGCALADLGDENGDGFEDLLVGASLESEAYVLEGDNPVHTLAVRSAAAAILSGARERGGGFGSALAASDLDGDGYGDALVSAPSARNVRGDAAGLVYAFYGPFSGDLDAADAHVRWEAFDPVGGFGTALASGGDVDGDGEPDTLIGDPFEDGYPYPGVAYLQLGEAAGTVDVRHMASFTEDAYAMLGYSVAFVPDWNGDGGDEIAIGAPGATTGSANGHVSVIFSDSLFE